MGNDVLWMRLRAVAWNEYQTSDSSPAKLPKLLQDLASRKPRRAMKASHEIWQALCKNKLHSASVVALPFLSEIAMISQPEIVDEIEDIYQSCRSLADNSEDWHQEIHRFLGEL